MPALISRASARPCRPARVLLACLLGLPLLASAAPPAAPASALQWLLGHWQRDDLPAGRSGDEHWWQQGTELHGEGSSYRAGELRFREQLRIVGEDGAVFYVAQVPGNPAPVKFRQVEQQGQSVLFENPAHDFPQRIHYRREGRQLTATISGDGREQVFQFTLRAGADD